MKNLGLDEKPLAEPNREEEEEEGEGKKSKKKGAKKENGVSYSFVVRGQQQ